MPASQHTSVTAPSPPGVPHKRSGSGRLDGRVVNDVTKSERFGDDLVVCRIDVVDGDDVHVGGDAVLYAEVQYLLGLGDAADQRASDADSEE